MNHHSNHNRENFPPVATRMYVKDGNMGFDPQRHFDDPEFILVCNIAKTIAAIHPSHWEQAMNSVHTLVDLHNRKHSDKFSNHDDDTTDDPNVTIDGELILIKIRMEDDRGRKWGYNITGGSSISILSQNIHSAEDLPTAKVAHIINDTPKREVSFLPTSNNQEHITTKKEVATVMKCTTSFVKRLISMF